ncbi:terminase [Corynebacterium diphtheriae]|uniref:terminase n=1 Tax=Corynebacterium diphtheriae TaxID=1717 RepID=UPI00217CF826|nr:terminase [Corynebacterium diphtheriae]
MTHLPPHSQPWPINPKPRFITAWPEKYNGVGKQICKLHRALGHEPMPWQVLFHTIVGARNADGRPRWPFIIVSVPRQSGKTDGVGAQAIHRTLTSPNGKIWYTAQTGQKARDRWLEMVASVNRSPFAAFARTLKTNGSEALKFEAINSQFRPHPPTADSLHSEQSDLNFIDEAWVFDDATAADLMQAITPTQATRPNRQTVIVSTMGDAGSTWFHGLVEKGRAGDPGIFLLEFGIADDVDPDDLEAVAAAHPAFGYTQDMEALRAAHASLGAAGFARGYGNRATGARNQLIPSRAYEQAKTLENMPADAPAILAAAIDFERTETAIAAATWADGVPMIEIIECRPGTSWAVDRLEALEALPLIEGLIIDDHGPSSTLIGELTRRGVAVRVPATREVSTAAADLMDRITHVDAQGHPAPRVLIRKSAALDQAVSVVDRRPLGESWTWSRKGSKGSIAALEAATLALHGLVDKPAADAVPFFR